MAKKTFKHLVTLFPLSVIITFSLYTDSFSERRETPACALNYIFSENILYRLNSGVKVKLYDRVLAISCDKDTLYYLRSHEDRWIAGFFRSSLNTSTEFEIPGRFGKFYKFEAYNNIFYFLSLPLKGVNSEDIPVFTRFNPDDMNLQSIDRVVDFRIIDGRSIILKNDTVDYNGSVIPLTLSGKPGIHEIIDSRIAVISSSEGTELIDLIAEKSIYQYKNVSVPELPEEYNLVLEFSDIFTKSDASPDMENSIYYEIYIDGTEENRTVTGRGDLVKIFHSNLSPGKYHIIKPERWELDKVKGRYSRVNNIFQPDELKIYIPENRIIKLRIDFDGTAYKAKQSVVYK